MGILFSDSLTDSQKQAIQNTFQQFQHPSLQKDLVSLNAIKKLKKAVRRYVLKSACRLLGILHSNNSRALSPQNFSH